MKCLLVQTLFLTYIPYFTFIYNIIYTVQSTFREKGSKDIFIVPMDRDLVLPEPDVAKIPCEICEDWILSFNHRKHMEDHAM